MESRTKNSSRNIITGITNKLVLLILAFVSRKIFINYIGIEYLGINSLFSNVLNLLSMADLGFGVAMAYSYYKPLADKDTKKLTALTHYYKKVYNVIAVAVAIIGVSLVPFLKYIVNMDKNIPYLYVFYLIILSNTVISYLFIYKASIINADQKAYMVNKINIYVNLSKTVLQCIFIIVFKNYFAYIIIQTLATFVNNLIISKVANENYPFLKETATLDEADRKNIFDNMKSVFLYKVAASLMGGTDSIIMSKICGTVIVGFYSNYQTITLQLTAFIQIIFQSLTASVGNMLTYNDSNKSYAVFKQMQMLSHWLSATVSVCILTLVQDFICLWLGQEYLMSDLMVWAIAINLYFSIAMQPIWSYREASGLYSKTKYVMLCTVAVNIGVSIVLGNIYGAPGVVIASVIARIVTYFWYEPSLIYKLYFKKPSIGYYVDFILSLGMIVLIRIVVSNFCEVVGIMEVSVLNWLLKAFITVVIISLCYLLRYWKTPEFSEMFGRICKLIKR